MSHQEQDCVLIELVVKDGSISRLAFPSCPFSNSANAIKYGTSICHTGDHSFSDRSALCHHLNEVHNTELAKCFLQFSVDLGH
jgi:hypothetical protein